METESGFKGGDSIPVGSAQSSHLLYRESELERRDIVGTMFRCGVGLFCIIVGAGIGVVFVVWLAKTVWV